MERLGPLDNDWLDDVGHARATVELLWRAWEACQYPFPCLEVSEDENKKRSTAREAARTLNSALCSAEYEAVWKFGTVNPDHPECEACLKYSVFDGPRHEPSKHCESGGRAHCTCDVCF